MSINTSVLLNWVTDTNRPKYKVINKNIINGLNSNRFIIKSHSIKSLDNGLTQFIYDVQELPGPMLTFNSLILSIESPVDDIIRAISCVIYRRVTLQISNTDLTGTEINGLTSIVKHLFRTLLQSHVDDVILDYFEDMLVWSPVPSIYKKDEQLYNFLKWTNLPQLVGKQYLSNDPLVRYALKQYQGEYNDIPPNAIEEYHGLYLIKAGLNINALKQHLTNFIARMRRQGFETLMSKDDLDKYLYLELAEMWEANIMDFENHVVIKSEIDFSVSTNIWYRQAVNSIKRGDLPIYMIHSYENNFKQFGGLDPLKDRDRVLLYYISVRAYSKLINIYPYLSPFLTDVYVNKHLTIIAKFGSYAEVKKFKQLLKAETLNGRFKNYRIFYFNKFETAVLHRYYFDQSNPGLTSVILEIDDVLNLVIDTDISNRLMLPEQLNNLKTEILEKVKRLCIGQAPLMTVDTPIMELLSLVPFKQENKPYCLNYQFINTLPVGFNPITNLPIEEQILNQSKYWKYGLMGYFNTYLMKGLLETPPMYTPTPPVDGNIKRGYPLINRIELENPNDKVILAVQVALHEDDFLIVLNKDLGDNSGLIRPMFDVLTDKSSTIIETQLDKLVLDLWSCGWFLSLWSSILMKNTGKLSRHLLEDHPIIFQAEDSILDGIRAIETMTLINGTVCKSP